MTLTEALYVRIGAVLLAAVVPLSTLVIVAAVEALVVVPALEVGETAVRPTEAVAAVAVCQLAARLYRLNVGGPAGSR